MYSLHKTEDHDAWRVEEDKKKEERRQTREQESASDKSSDSTKDDEVREPATQRLTLSNNMRAALVTQCGLSSDEVDQLYKDVGI